MVRFHPRMASRSRAALCWTVALFVGAQLALGHFITYIHPELRDPEFGSLLNALQARRAEAPGRPLVLVLGSSRTANLVRPSAIAARPDGRQKAVVFNFATLATGPLRQLQVFRRLLAHGIEPSVVVAEMWPPFLTQRKSFAEESYILDRDLQRPDVPLIAGYFAEPWPAYGKLLLEEFAPASSHRRRILRHYAPFLLPQEPIALGDWSDPRLRQEGSGWLPAPVPRPPAELFEQNIALGEANTRSILEHFTITDVADRALRELIRTCLVRGVRVALVLVPEHSSLRHCIAPEVQAASATYLGMLSREYGVPVVDVRDWVPDEDFIDMTHVLPCAAGAYTQRLGREVLGPLLEGQSPAAHLLLHEIPSSPAGPASAP